jgi:hypothetical protein
VFLARLGPVVQRHGHARILIELEGFTGWGPESPWDDLTFSLRFRDRIHRCAVVAPEKDRMWMRRLAEPFTNVRLFAPDERERAWLWVAEGAGSDTDHEAIRRLAYAKWEAAGRPPGDGVPFWLEAERELSLAG